MSWLDQSIEPWTLGKDTVEMERSVAQKSGFMEWDPEKRVMVAVGDDLDGQFIDARHIQEDPERCMRGGALVKWREYLYAEADHKRLVMTMNDAVQCGYQCAFLVP
ncbi:MAG: hypothetical protein ABIA47_01865 [bacterium]